MSTDIPVLEARSVSKAFGDTRVFDNLSLTVRPGEVLVVRGANGSGKSTLLRCLIGADYFDTGDVLLHGVPFDPRVPSIRSAVAAGLGGGDRFLDLTVREHLEFTARAHGDGDPEALIDSVLADLGLAGVADRFPFALSQGQRRRLGLAACFVRPRKLLVLDEPEQNLDPAVGTGSPRS